MAMERVISIVIYVIMRSIKILFPFFLLLLSLTCYSFRKVVCNAVTERWLDGIFLFSTDLPDSGQTITGSYIFVYLSIYLSIYLSTYLSICLSMHEYIYIFMIIYVLYRYDSIAR